MDLFSPLAHPVYRKLFTAQVVALLGTGLTTIALALLAHDLAGERAGAVLGTALALKMVAYVGIAPVVGAIAHRLPRRRLLIGLDLARAAMVLLLPFVDAIWQIYLLVFLLNACSAGFTPTFQATIPDVLPDEDTYTRALSLSRLAYDLENLLSPLFAALALALVGYSTLFVCNGVAFLVSAGLVLSLTLPAPRASDRPHGLRTNLGFGVRAYLTTPRLRGVFALGWAVAAASAMVIVNTVVLVRDRLGLSDTETALAYAAAGGGSMLLALLVPRLLTVASRDRTLMLAGGWLLAVAMLAAPWLIGTDPAAYPSLLLLWFLLGAGLSVAQTPIGRILRRSAGEADRPAYFSAQFALSHLGWLVCYPLAGWLGAVFGVDTAFVGLGLVALIGAVMATRLWPAGDAEVLGHRHESYEHEHPHVHDEHHQHGHEGWEGPEPHCHPHRHDPTWHAHPFFIDLHHPSWPGQPQRHRH